MEKQNEIIEYVRSSLISLHDGLAAYDPDFTILRLDIPRGDAKDRVMVTLRFGDHLLVHQESLEECRFNRGVLVWGLCYLNEHNLLPHDGEVYGAVDSELRTLTITFREVREVSELYKELRSGFRIPVKATHTTKAFWDEYNQSLLDDPDWLEWVAELFCYPPEEELWVINKALVCEVIEK